MGDICGCGGGAHFVIHSNTKFEELTEFERKAIDDAIEARRATAPHDANLALSIYMDFSQSDLSWKRNVAFQVTLETIAGRMRELGIASWGTAALEELQTPAVE